MYTMNLVMGGDKYTRTDSDSTITLQLANASNPVDYGRLVTTYSDKYKVTDNKIMYAALPNESNLYRQTPTLAKVALLSQLKSILSASNFDFKTNDIPTWWNENFKGDSLSNNHKMVDKVDELLESQKALLKNQELDKGERKK